MISDLLKHTGRFFLLVLLQLFVLNNIQVSGYVSPMLYILFLLMLPFETPPWLAMLSCFLMGLALDFFCDTPGLHSATLVLMAFMRRFILNLFSPREGYESNTVPTLQYLGWSWYLWYAGIMVVLHAFVFFMLEAFRWTEFFHTLLRIILSSAVTLGMIVLYQLLLSRQKSR